MNLKETDVHGWCFPDGLSFAGLEWTFNC